MIDRDREYSGRPFTRISERPVFPVLTMLFLTLTFAIKAFTDGPYLRGEVSQTIAYSKYITAAVACTFALMGMVGKKGRRFSHEFNDLMIIMATFTIASVMMQLFAGEFSTNVAIELIKLAMPMILAYCVLNVLDDQELYGCMVIILAVSLAGYFVELRSQGVSISSVFSASIDEGSSATESSSFSDIALMLTFYFAYFNRRRLPLILSAGFTLLAFKRLAMVVAVIVLVIGIAKPSFAKKQVSGNLITFLKIATLILACLWFWMLLPEQQDLFISIFGKSPFDFTMGRSASLRYLWTSGFQSYGFGSANEVVKAWFGVPFEMDLIRIAFELTPLATILFVWLFWDIAGASAWGVMIVGYYMLNMITSDSLTSNFAFTLAYIVLGLVNQGGRARKKNGFELVVRQ